MCSREIHLPSSTCIHNVCQIEKQFFNVLFFPFILFPSFVRTFVYSVVFSSVCVFLHRNSSYAVTRQAEKWRFKSLKFSTKIVFFLLKAYRKKIREFSLRTLTIATFFYATDWDDVVWGWFGVWNIQENKIGKQIENIVFVSRENSHSRNQYSLSLSLSLFLSLAQCIPMKCSQTPKKNERK